MKKKEQLRQKLIEVPNKDLYGLIQQLVYWDLVEPWWKELRPKIFFSQMYFFSIFFYFSLFFIFTNFFWNFLFFFHLFVCISFKKIFLLNVFAFFLIFEMKNVFFEEWRKTYHLHFSKRTTNFLEKKKGQNFFPFLNGPKGFFLFLKCEVQKKERMKNWIFQFNKKKNN